jgi:hypothetical protein
MAAVMVAEGVKVQVMAPEMAAIAQKMAHTITSNLKTM